MSSVGLSDESAADGAAGAEPWWRWLVYALGVPFYLCIVFLRTFHLWESALFFALAALPATLVVIVFLLQDGGELPLDVEDDNGRKSRLGTLFHIFVILTFAPGVLILFADQMFDGSPAEPQTFNVEAREHGPGWTDRTIYSVRVVPPGRSPLRGWTFEPTEPVEVSYEDWKRVVPGQTTLTLAVHKGLFGFPWYERRHSLANLGEANDPDLIPWP